MTPEQWLKYHSIYERKAFRVIRQSLRDSIVLDWNNLTPSTYEIAIRMNVREEIIKQGYFDLYFQIGLLHGKRTGRELQKLIERDRREQKDFSLPRFTNIFRQAISAFIERLAPTRITSVSQTLADYLVNEFGKGLRQGKTIPVLAKEMEKLVDSRNFYRWQALRIARTETTAAANYGALMSGFDSGVEMEKEWITSEDERVRYRPEDRFDHRVMDKVRIDLYREFQVQGDFIQYPGDPSGNASNIINCRCTLGMVPKRDANGRLIYKD